MIHLWLPPAHSVCLINTNTRAMKIPHPCLNGCSYILSYSDSCVETVSASYFKEMRGAALIRGRLQSAVNTSTVMQPVYPQISRATLLHKITNNGLTHLWHTVALPTAPDSCSHGKQCPQCLFVWRTNPFWTVFSISFCGIFLTFLAIKFVQKLTVATRLDPLSLLRVRKDGSSPICKQRPEKRRWRCQMLAR